MKNFELPPMKLLHGYKAPYTFYYQVHGAAIEGVLKMSGNTCSTARQICGKIYLVTGGAGLLADVLLTWSVRESLRLSFTSTKKALLSTT